MHDIKASWDLHLCTKELIDWKDKTKREQVRDKFVTDEKGDHCIIGCSLLPTFPGLNFLEH